MGVEDAELPGIPATGTLGTFEVEEARRVLYVGMTRAMDRLVLTRAATRAGRPTGGHRFLDEMQLAPGPPGSSQATAIRVNASTADGPDIGPVAPDTSSCLK